MNRIGMPSCAQEDLQRQAERVFPPLTLLQAYAPETFSRPSGQVGQAVSWELVVQGQLN